MLGNCNSRVVRNNDACYNMELLFLLSTFTESVLKSIIIIYRLCIIYMYRNYYIIYTYYILYIATYSKTIINRTIEII